MNRNCPVCNSANRDVFHIQQFTDGTTQEVGFCLKCGMPYAWKSPEANYDRESKYAVPDGCGSGENSTDKQRLQETAAILAEIPLPLDAAILEIGCARGGLLEALKALGFTDVTGIDPSEECVRACREKELTAFRGDMDFLPSMSAQFDCIVLSHVLEHIWDVPKALQGIRGRLKPGGYFYIEVPDAARYLEYLNIPFLDFNREHVNHFDIQRLRHALCNAGLNNGNAVFGTREIVLPCGKYPAIYAIGKNETYDLKDKLTRYMELSEVMLKDISDQVSEIPYGQHVVVWGYGEFFQRFFKIPGMSRLTIVQIIDKDPSKHRPFSDKIGINGVGVEPPEMIVPHIPIVVASVVNKESILADIKANPLLKDRQVITL